MSKKRYGQYFTPQIIVDYMIFLSNIDKKSTILEPSSGEGIFLHSLKKMGYKNIVGYEIDRTLYKDATKPQTIYHVATSNNFLFNII